MAERIEEQHKLLVAVSANGSIGVKIIGATFDNELEPLDDLEFGGDVFAVDRDPGLYVWEGTFILTDKYQVFRDGTLRFATVDDLGFFGFPPLVETVRAGG